MSCLHLTPLVSSQSVTCQGDVWAKICPREGQISNCSHGALLSYSRLDEDYPEKIQLAHKAQWLLDTMTKSLLTFEYHSNTQPSARPLFPAEHVQIAAYMTQWSVVRLPCLPFFVWRSHDSSPCTAAAVLHGSARRLWGQAGPCCQTAGVSYQAQMRPTLLPSQKQAEPSQNQFQ